MNAKLNFVTLQGAEVSFMSSLSCTGQSLLDMCECQAITEATVSFLTCR